MSKKPIVQKLEKQHLKGDIPAFNVGDTVRVHTRIIEGNKERIQIFTGTVIARKGVGLSETFSLHRVAYGEGMERVFLLHSPRIAKIEVVSHGDVRRSKLYYLRGTSGKKAKVKSKIGGKKAAKVAGDKEVAAEENIGEEEEKEIVKVAAETYENDNVEAGNESDAAHNENDESSQDSEAEATEKENADA